MKNQASNFNFHPFKLRTRGLIARAVSEFMASINPKTIRTLSFAGDGYDFESVPIHNSLRAERLEKITNVCVERVKDIFMTSPVPIMPEDRARVSRIGEVVKSSYKVTEKLSVETCYVFDEMENVLGVGKRPSDYSWEDSTYDAHKMEQVEMDLVWLDYYGSYNNNVRNQIKRFAAKSSALTGLVFITLECIGRSATAFNKANAPERNAGSEDKAIWQSGEVEKTLRAMENLRQVLKVEYVGQGGSPMVLIGFSWQKKRELSEQRKETIPIVRMTAYDGGGQWKMPRAKKAQSIVSKAVKKATKNALKPDAEETGLLRLIALQHDLDDKGEHDDKRTVDLMKDYPQLIQFVPPKMRGPHTGQPNWAGIKAAITREKNYEEVK